MTAHGEIGGHPVSYSETAEEWRYDDTSEPVSDVNHRPCRQCGQHPKRIAVPIPADLSHTGKERIALKPIDACIADLVQGLNEHGIKTRASCCGHGNNPGVIVLEDFDMSLPLVKRAGL